MRLLLLTPQLPYPQYQGTTIRNFNIIKHLARAHEVTLLSFGTPAELENAPPLRALCQHVEIAPSPTRTLLNRASTTFLSSLPDMALRLHSQPLRAKLRDLLAREQFDLVQVEGIEMAEAWRLEVRDWRSARPISIFDDHNAEYALQRTAFEADARDPRRWHAALYSWIQWRKLACYERNTCASADHVIVCSEADAQAIRSLFRSETLAPPATTVAEVKRSGRAVVRNPKSEITVVPNGVDTDHYIPSDAVCAKPLAAFALVFTGKMDYRPNIDAMVWFCRAILPRIRAEIPHAHIRIVGQKPAPKIRALANLPGVQVTGAVDDTRPYVADAAAYVVPLRMGSGTRLKVLEALALGKAIVSTTRGVEGIALEPNRDALVADSPDEFARAVIPLLRDAERRRVLGAAARKLAVEKYDWRAILPKFDEVYAKALGDRGREETCAS